MKKKHDNNKDKSEESNVEEDLDDDSDAENLENGIDTLTQVIAGKVVQNYWLMSSTSFKSGS